MKKIAIFLVLCLSFACSSDDTSDSNGSSTLKIDGKKYTFDALLLSDASAFPLSDPEMKTHYFYLTKKVPCDGAPCSRPIGMYIKIVKPPSQASLVGTYSFNTDGSPYAYVLDYKSDTHSVSGGVQVALGTDGKYELTFLENTVLSGTGGNFTLTGKVKGFFQTIPFDYRTANGQWN